MFFRFIRWFLGGIILFYNDVFSPRGVVRPADEQSRIDGETSRLALYQFEACPFCVKTRRAMKRLSLNIETRDAKNDESHRAALLAGGGQIKVPCLRIAHDDGREEWMYESSDIIAYLQGRFGAAA